MYNPIFVHKVTPPLLYIRLGGGYGVPWKKNTFGIVNSCQSIGVIRLGIHSVEHLDSHPLKEKSSLHSPTAPNIGLDRFLHPPWRRSIWPQQHKLQWTSARLINRADLDTTLWESAGMHLFYAKHAVFFWGCWGDTYRLSMYILNITSMCIYHP